MAGERHFTKINLRKKNSGEGEIRTLEALASLTVFETVAFDHSATSPGYAFMVNG